jgi:release factor glutamine methyltransferase
MTDQPQWTIKELLDWITGYLTEKAIDAPRLSAELLLSHVLDTSRIELYTNYRKSVAPPELARLRELVKRAAAHEPIAYLTGRTEFYSIELDIAPGCLIPRPETELLVEYAIRFLRGRKGRSRLCDLCTGSGCIAIAVAKNLPDVDIIATDISESALETAARNIEKYDLRDRITLLKGDLFEPLLPHLDDSLFDMITCNPPYVNTRDYDDLPRNVRDYEPREALFAGDDGLDIIRRLAEKLPDFLKPAGTLLLEIAYNQADRATQLLRLKNRFADVHVEKDDRGRDRLVSAQK